jgi:hypothetical protein
MTTIRRVVWLVFLCSAATSVLVGGFSVFAALDHNPQGIYSDDPAKLVPIFATNALAAFLAMLLLGALMTGIVRLARYLLRVVRTWGP